MVPNTHLSCNLSPSLSTVPRRSRNHNSPLMRMGKSRSNGPQRLAVAWPLMMIRNLHLTRLPTPKKWEAELAGSSSCKLTQRNALTLPTFSTYGNIAIDYYLHSCRTSRSERTTTIRHTALQAQTSFRKYRLSPGSFLQLILTPRSSRHRDFWREVPYMLRDVVDHLCTSFRPKYNSRGGYISV